jgi:hypothetical protein
LAGMTMRLSSPNAFSLIRNDPNSYLASRTMIANTVKWIADNCKLAHDHGNMAWLIIPDIQYLKSS